MIQISIVEDSKATREAFLKILRKVPEIVCLATYGSAEEAEREMPKCLPDVVLMDIDLPGRNGISCVAKLKLAHPQVEFLMLTVYDDSDLIFEALRCGATGYLLKHTPAAELIEAIKEIHRGGSPMTMEIARRVASHFRHVGKPATGLENLTKREHELLALLAQGLAYKQIADRLEISHRTVQSHLYTVYKKLHVQSRTEATNKYYMR
jgi:DNA-binding NarL/FixJ family response regulator